MKKLQNKGIINAIEDVRCNREIIILVIIIIWKISSVTFNNRKLCNKVNIFAFITIISI